MVIAMVIAAVCAPALHLGSVLHFVGKMQKPLINDRALSMLVCPMCHAALTSPNQDTILCTGCGRRYPIRDGLPALLKDAAQR